MAHLRAANETDKNGWVTAVDRVLRERCAIGVGARHGRHSARPQSLPVEEESFITYAVKRAPPYPHSRILGTLPGATNAEACTTLNLSNLLPSSGASLPEASPVAMSPPFTSPGLSVRTVTALAAEETQTTQPQVGHIKSNEVHGGCLLSSLPTLSSSSGPAIFIYSATLATWTPPPPPPPPLTPLHKLSSVDASVGSSSLRPCHTRCLGGSKRRNPTSHRTNYNHRCLPPSNYQLYRW